MRGEGVNGLPVHVIRSADGCSAEVTCNPWDPRRLEPQPTSTTTADTDTQYTFGAHMQVYEHGASCTSWKSDQGEVGALQ